MFFTPQSLMKRMVCIIMFYHSLTTKVIIQQPHEQPLEIRNVVEDNDDDNNVFNYHHDYTTEDEDPNPNNEEKLFTQAKTQSQ